MATASFSKLNCLSRCWRKYYYTYILNLQRKIYGVKPALGKYIHGCLECHYSGGDYTKVIQNLNFNTENMFDEEKEEWEKLPATLIKIMRGYVFAYKNIDINIKTIFTEKEFNITLEPYNHILTGVIDWGFEDEQGFWVCDHKTTNNIPDANYTFGDIQTTLYYYAVNSMGYSPLGIVFNFIKSKPPKQPDILKDGKSISRAKIDTDIATYMATVRAIGADPKDYTDMVDKLSGNTFYKRVRVPKPETLVKNLIKDTLIKMDRIDDLESKKNYPDLFYRSIIKDRCEWECEFSALCFAELAGQDTEFLLQNNYEERK